MRQKNVAVTIKAPKDVKIIPVLIPHASDSQIIKKRHSAFFGTGWNRSFWRKV